MTARRSTSALSASRYFVAASHSTRVDAKRRDLCRLVAMLEREADVDEVTRDVMARVERGLRRG